MTATLRPYQQEAVNAFLTSDGHSTLAMAPGSGKSVTACAIIRALKVGRSLIVVPTLVLRDQWIKVLGEQRIEILATDNRRGWKPKYGEVPLGHQCAEIVTYAWAAKHADDESFWDRFIMVVWDEVHHLGYGNSFRRLLIPAHKARYSLGLSATPPPPVDGEENLAMRVMPVVFTYSFSEGREQGYTAEIEVVPIPVKLTDDEYVKYKDLTSMIREMIAIYGKHYQSRPWVGSTYEPLQGDPPKRIYGGTITNARRQLVALAEEKFERLDRLMSEVLRLDQQVPDDEPYARVFVWSEYVEVLEKAKEVLNRNGQIAELVTGKTPKKERVRIIQEAWGRDFPILLVARVGEEGLDAPESAVGVVLAGAKTQRQTIQRLGRLLRPFPGKKAKLYVIYAKGVPMDEKVVALMNEVSA